MVIRTVFVHLSQVFILLQFQTKSMALNNQIISSQYDTPWFDDLTKGSSQLSFHDTATDIINDLSHFPDSVAKVKSKN